jgi:hypothetical protein
LQLRGGDLWIQPLAPDETTKDSSYRALPISAKHPAALPTAAAGGGTTELKWLSPPKRIDFS